MANIPQNGDRSASLWGLVLAGGDGKRLQSYIRATRGNDLPKQYVSFVGKQSLFERTCRRSEWLIPAERIFTIVSRHHLRHDEVRRQLTDRVNGTVIIQPANRETGPGLLLPLMHLYKRCPDAIVAVFPSDHFIVEEERFMDHVQLAARAVECDPSKIVLLAMEADKPEVEYGYIIPLHPDGQFNPWGLRRAVKFIEKPDVELAARLINSGALWNTMIMVFKVCRLVELMGQLYPKLLDQFTRILDVIGTPRESSTVEAVYRDLPPLNFSRGVLEKLTESNPETLSVLPVLQVSWSDWGSPARLMQCLELLKHGSLQRNSPPSVQQPQTDVTPKRRRPRPAPLGPLYRALSIALCFLALGAVGIGSGQRAWAQNVASREDASRVLIVENLKVEDGQISGTVQNRSASMVRDVELFIRNTWLWDNETKPGKNDPGVSEYYNLTKPIPPGGQATFNYRPTTPLGKPASGHYQTSVSIAGYSEIIPQTR
jgi:mannose-1-phosphate guanylyltransferase